MTKEEYESRINDNDNKGFSQNKLQKVRKLIMGDKNINDKLLDTVVDIVNTSTENNNEALRILERVNRNSMIKDALLFISIIIFFLILYLF